MKNYRLSFYGLSGFDTQNFDTLAAARKWSEKQEKLRLATPVALYKYNAELDQYEELENYELDKASLKGARSTSVVPAPDPSISVEDMKDAGYLWEGMLPLRLETAIKIWDRNLPVYRLYDDDSEGMIMDAEEFEHHAEMGGIFGIEKEDWSLFLAKNPMFEQSATHSVDEFAPLDETIAEAEKRATIGPRKDGPFVKELERLPDKDNDEGR